LDNLGCGVTSQPGKSLYSRLAPKKVMGYKRNVIASAAWQSHTIQSGYASVQLPCTL